MALRVPGGGRWPMGYRLSAAQVPPRSASRRWNPQARARRQFGPAGMADESAYWQTERRQILKAYESQLEGILRHVKGAIADLDQADGEADDEEPPPYVIRGRFEPKQRHRAPAKRAPTKRAPGKRQGSRARKRNPSKRRG